MREPIRDKERLEHMVEAIDNIFSFAKGKTVEDLDNEKILFYAVAKNIEIIGEAAFRLTKEFRQQHSETPWSSIVVMRHVLVHDYYQIKSKEVYKVINEDLQPLRDQIVLYTSETDWETSLTSPPPQSSPSTPTGSWQSFCRLSCGLHERSYM